MKKAGGFPPAVVLAVRDNDLIVDRDGRQAAVCLCLRQG
jgi:hypothetical protein